MIAEAASTGHELLRGWSGVALEYLAVQAPMWVAMARGRAQWRAFRASPLLAGALMVGTGIGMSLASPFLHGMHIASGGLMEFAVGAGLGGLLGYGGGVVLATPDRNDEGYIRGTTVIDADEAVARGGASSGKVRGRGRSMDDRRAGITLAGVPVAEADETKHFKLMGATGAGKSTAITELLTGALRRGDRAIIADPDGGYMRRFYDPGRGDVILS
ncbi:MAG: type IV secretion system DNA-binding domain-containing protein, partial [Steroidobacteraceae bacterium]